MSEAIIQGVPHDPLDDKLDEMLAKLDDTRVLMAEQAQKLDEDRGQVGVKAQAVCEAIVVANKIGNRQLLVFCSNVGMIVINLCAFLYLLSRL